MLPGVREGAVCDLELEVFGDLVAVADPSDAFPDLAGVGVAQRSSGALDHRFDLRQFGLGGLQELLAFAGPLGRDGRVAADDEPLAGELGGADLGQVGLVEERQLQVAGGDQLADLRRLEGADEADPRLGERGRVRLGEHAAVADHDDIRDPEALPHQGDRGGQRLLVLRRARVDTDRDGAALGRAGQPVGDLRLAPHPVAGVAKRGQGAAAPLHVAGGEVVEHEPLPLQVAPRERLLDPLLTRQQPVHRGQQLGLLDHAQIELRGERRLPKTTGRRQLRSRPEQPLHDHRNDEVALPAARP